jgi:sulfate adenylyltransferase subunit 2
MSYIIDYLDELEAEAIFILREVKESFKNIALLFSGGKDSIVLVHLAIKAFYPAKIPFTLLHIDTGYNFPEVEVFKNKLADYLDIKLINASVATAVENGELVDETNKDRNRLQIPVLLKAIQSNDFDVAIGGGRRDEEKARAKERIFSHRDHNGKWNPENQRPELWNLFNSRKENGQHFRVFPLSNWTELDIWQYIKKENIEIPEIYFAHNRKVVDRNGMIIADSEYLQKSEKDIVYKATIRCRTVGDILTTGLWLSEAKSLDEIIDEISISGIGERGNRADDKVSATSMEDRKRQGYF